MKEWPPRTNKGKEGRTRVLTLLPLIGRDAIELFKDRTITSFEISEDPENGFFAYFRSTQDPNKVLRVHASPGAYAFTLTLVEMDDRKLGEIIKLGGVQDDAIVREISSRQISRLAEYFDFGNLLRANLPPASPKKAA